MHTNRITFYVNTDATGRRSAWYPTRHDGTYCGPRGSAVTVRRMTDLEETRAIITKLGNAQRVERFGPQHAAYRAPNNYTTVRAQEDTTSAWQAVAPLAEVGA